MRNYIESRSNKCYGKKKERSKKNSKWQGDHKGVRQGPRKWHLVRKQGLRKCGEEFQQKEQQVRSPVPGECLVHLKNNKEAGVAGAVYLRGWAVGNEEGGWARQGQTSRGRASAFYLKCDRKRAWHYLLYDLRGPLAGVFGEKTVGCRRKKTSEKATVVVDAREDGAIFCSH